MCWFSILLTLGQVWSVINYAILKCLQLWHKVESLLETLLLPEDFEALCLLSFRKHYVLQVSMSDQCLLRICWICFLIFLRSLLGNLVTDFWFSSHKYLICVTFFWEDLNLPLLPNVYFFFSFQTHIWTPCKAEHHLKPVEWGTKWKSSKYIILFMSVVIGWDLN